MKNLLYILLFSVQFAFAQSELPEGFGDYRTIENPEIGRGYIRTVIPAQFEIEVERRKFCLLEKNQELLNDLEEGKDYEIRLETIEIKPTYKTYKIKAPNYHRNINFRTFISEEGWETVEKIDSNYQVGDTIIEKIKIRDTYSQFVPFYENIRMNPKDCISANLETTAIWTYKHFREVNLRQRKVIHKNDTTYQLKTLSDTIKYGYVDYIFDSTYHLIETIVSAKIDTFKTVYFFNDNIEKVMTTLKITKYNMLNMPYLSEWREIFCPKILTNSSISIIQRALNDRGYKVEINNIFDAETKKALIQFQKDNFLPIGQLDNETLKELGYY